LSIEKCGVFRQYLVGIAGFSAFSIILRLQIMLAVPTPEIVLKIFQFPPNLLLWLANNSQMTGFSVYLVGKMRRKSQFGE